ncbi:tyrosine-type recombinase/integrase [Polyangium sp. 15x6]|uniref:tyrosine-type recombinase/integrase n=1 Tax=Polyangium sp. 15x6 TaxID=3042687 RepID=UPI00249B232E|nr:tyrosine-type recombinase/integrase [Polyangium sp. 15x6]MDI3282133.1 tyrosine-type recombinase/integrase [Polyangium sp. 15x6]
MTIRKANRRGQPVLIVDIHYRRKDGSQGRYRKDAHVQTMAGARAEERRLLALIATYGEPTEPRVEVVVAPAPAITFEEAVGLFRSGKAVTRLKPSTRKGYEEILETRLLPRFGETPIDKLTGSDVEGLDAVLVDEGCSPSRRRNVLIVIRSVLRAAVEAKKLSALPDLPPLPKTGKKVLRCLTAEQVEAILGKAKGGGRVALALAAYAGLRAGEVRALRWEDVDLDGGFLVVRFSHSKGEVSTPKSGHQREVPLAARLAELLREVRGEGLGLVTVSSRKEAWGEWGLTQLFKRAAKKVGIVGFRFHDLRHFFVTELFRRGGSAPAVQALAGHEHLSTTSRYAHVARADLRATVGLLARSR